MNFFSKDFENLIDELAKLPGIGNKSASRLAFYLVNGKKEYANNLSNAISNAIKNVKHCEICNTITDEDICPICRDEKRDKNTIMIVENERDMFQYERVGEYKGVYQVLGGFISPLLGIGPSDLKIDQLMKRINENTKEVIIATNATVEGETTASYLIEMLKKKNVKITRIAQGVPVGGDIENIDEITLQRAYLGRVEVNESV